MSNPYLLQFYERLVPSTFSPFFYLILSIVGGMGILLTLLKSLMPSHAAIKKVWQAYTPWLVLAPIGYLALSFGSLTFMLLLLFCSLLCLKEFFRATGTYQDLSFVGVVYLTTCAIYLSELLSGRGLAEKSLIFGILSLSLIPILRNRYEGMLQNLALSLFALIYFSWFPSYLASIATKTDGTLYLLFLFLGIELNDAAAYLSGKLWGKHPLISRISPNKTVEGTLGAFLFIALYVLLTAHWLPFAPASFQLFAFGLIALGGALGDLLVSVIKRDIGVKDMGALIPGHGGLLDRLDSLLFVSPLYFYLLQAYQII